MFKTVVATVESMDQILKLLGSITWTSNCYLRISPVVVVVVVVLPYGAVYDAVQGGSSF